MSETASAPAAAPAARRRSPTTLLAVAGLLLAAGYGALIAKMSFGAPLVMLGLGGLVVAMIGVTFWRAVNPLLRPDAAAAEGPRAPARLRDLERDKQLVIKAIREIEHDYLMRKISEEDYKDMVQRYRTRALRLMREIDAGDDYRSLIEQELKGRLAALEAAIKAGAACAGCGTGNDKDAEFCKKCGAKLAGGAS